MCIAKALTRAFGPGFEELPQAYIHAGQPVIIPGSMGTCSYVLAGTEKVKTSLLDPVAMALEDACLERLQKNK